MTWHIPRPHEVSGCLPHLVQQVLPPSKAFGVLDDGFLVGSIPALAKASSALPRLLSYSRTGTPLGLSCTRYHNRACFSHKVSAPYHPATNGEAERAVRTVKEHMNKMVDGGVTDIDK